MQTHEVVSTNQFGTEGHVVEIYGILSGTYHLGIESHKTRIDVLENAPCMLLRT